jgi:ATP-dependent RNA helicase DDX1
MHFSLALILLQQHLVRVFNAIFAIFHFTTFYSGRLNDFISGGQISLSQVRFFILDEAVCVQCFVFQLTILTQDGLLAQGHKELIVSVHKGIPKCTPDGRRLQMIVCSATLHNFDVKKLAVYFVFYIFIISAQDQLMHFPQWVDLKGEDSVPDTVHHVVVICDPKKDRRWIRQHSTKQCIQVSVLYL